MTFVTEVEMGDRFKMLRVYFSMQLSPHKMEAVAEEDVFTFSQTAFRQVRRLP